MDRWSWLLTHPILLVGLGGALGSNARYWIGRWVVSKPWGSSFPWGTFIVNITGAFLLGLGVIYFLERMIPARREWHLFFGVGFCGGYTTFSTFQYETFQLLRAGKPGLALINVLGSVMAGFLAVWLAVRLIEETE